jgi:hypothetical protein
MKPTHRRITRTAECIQWDGYNISVFRSLIPDASFEIFREKYLISRGSTLGFLSLKLGDWIVKGEDRIIRFYPEEKFKLMYEKLLS